MRMSVTPAVQLYDIQTVIGNPKNLNQYFSSLAKMALEAPKLRDIDVNEVMDSYKRFIANKISTIYEHRDTVPLYKCTFETTVHRGGVKTIAVKEDPSNQLHLPERLLKDNKFANYLKTIKDGGRVELREMYLHPDDYIKLNCTHVNLILRADVCITTHRFKDESI